MKKDNKRRKFSNIFKKLKKTNPYFRFAFFATLFIYLLSVILFTYSIILLSGIENLIRVVVIGILIIYLIVHFFIGTALLIQKKYGWLITITLLTIIFTCINIFGYYYIKKTYTIVDNISKEKIIYTTDLVALNKDTQIKTVGLIKDEKNVEGYILPQEYMAVNSKKYKIIYYDNNIDLLNALLNRNVDAIFIGSNYIIQYKDEDGFSNLDTQTVVIDQYSKKMDNQDTVSSTNKDVTQPFTILLLGVDSEYDGLSNNSAFNGDSIMLVTFNPKTLSATVFSIPRDTYVPIACNNNKSYKINSAAGYGTNCMINTIKNLTDISIDYYVKINFKGVVALVNALGGINVDVDEPDFSHNESIDCHNMVCEQNSNREFGENTVYIKPGKNVYLNGEQALAYSRDRHQWALSDFKRIEHQQAVVTAIVQKTKTITNINTFYKVLNAVSNNIDTNMSTKEMLNFYNVGKNVLTNNNFADGEFINVQKTYLSGYDLSLYMNGGTYYTFQYYEESLNEIVKAMKVNLEIEKPELIKTFNFSVNEEYIVPTIGKSFTAAKRNETLPDFTGSSINYVESWAASRGITINKTYTAENGCTNNYILNQNIHSGSLVSNITSLNVSICQNSETSIPTLNPITTTTTTTNNDSDEEPTTTTTSQN